MLEERPNPDWPISEEAKWRPDLMMEDETDAADWNGGGDLWPCNFPINEV